MGKGIKVSAANTAVPNLSKLLEAAAAGVDPVTLLDPANIAAARASWAAFRIGQGFKGYAPIMTRPDGQLKLALNDVYTLGLTLASGDASGFEACAWRNECSKVCVLSHGKGSLPSVQRARIARTLFAAAHTAEFLTLVASESAAARDKFGRVAVRLNVNSDLRWHRIAPGFFNGSVFGPDVVFYDYSKNPALLATDGKLAANYRVTYSFSETSNPGRVMEFLKRGGTVAIVTNRKKTTAAAPVLPFMGELFAAVDGDAHDNRFMDPAGVIVDLAAKGTARTNPGKFVQRLYV